MTKSIQAGDLGSDHLGRKVSVSWQSGNITSTVDDELTEIVHGISGVTLRFKQTTWRPFTVLGGPADVGLTVKPDCIVTIPEEEQ